MESQNDVRHNGYSYYVRGGISSKSLFSVFLTPVKDRLLSVPAATFTLKLHANPESIPCQIEINVCQYRVNTVSIDINVCQYRVNWHQCVPVLSQLTSMCASTVSIDINVCQYIVRESVYICVNTESIDINSCQYRINLLQLTSIPNQLTSPHVNNESIDFN